MRRFWDRLDDFTRFCLDWGTGATQGIAGRRGAAPLLTFLALAFGLLMLWLAVWLSAALGWNQ